MSAIGDLIGRHPVVTYAMTGLLALGFLVGIAGSGGEGSESAEALEAARIFYEQNAEVEVSERNRHLLGRDFVDIVTRAYEAQKDEGAGPIFFSGHMQERTQRRFEALADEAFETRMVEFPAWRFGVGHAGTPPQNFLLHVFVHESALALVVTLIFLVIAGIGLETAWGSALFAGFCLLGTLLPAIAYRFLDASAGVPLSGASGLVAALLGAYAIRGLGGSFRLPGWALLPVWLFVELLFVRSIWIENVSTAPVATFGAGMAFGGLAALAIKVLDFEHKRVDRAEAGARPERHPALELAARAAESGSSEGVLEALQKAHAEVPKDREVALAYWKAACEGGQADDAASAMLPILRDAVRSGDGARAIELWKELTVHAPGTMVEPALAIRVGESLLDEGDPDAALDALRRAVDHPRGLGTGLAQRVVRVARDLDPDLTHRAAAVALQDETLDAASRASLETLVDEVRASLPPPTPAPAADPAAAATTPTATAPTSAAPTSAAPPAAAPAAPPPASAPGLHETTRYPTDSDIDLQHVGELGDPSAFDDLSLDEPPDGRAVEADLEAIDPNALSIHSLQREFAGNLGLADGEELTDPHGAASGDPLLTDDIGERSATASTLFDHDRLDSEPLGEDPALAMPPPPAAPAFGAGSSSDTAPVAPLGATPPAATNAPSLAPLGSAAASAAPEPPDVPAPLSSPLPPLGAAPTLEDLERYVPTDGDVDPLAAPTPPAPELAAPVPPQAPTAAPPPMPAAPVPPAAPAPPAVPAPPAAQAPPPASPPPPAAQPAAPAAPAAVPVVAPPPAVGRDLTDVVDLAVGSGLRRLKVVKGVPVGLKPDAIQIEVDGKGASKVPFTRIDAVAVAAVSGLSAKPVLVIDLVLNWLADPDEPLKVIRLQSNHFNPVRLLPSAGKPLEALKRLVAGLLQRSGATPLPDPGAAAGTPYKTFPDLESYQRQVLCAE